MTSASRDRLKLATKTESLHRHTEGTAGLASLIGASLALQHGIIPPNMHFKTLSPRVAPFYTHLEVPTEAKPWPSPAPGQPRRASINSFGEINSLLMPS
jgi:hybrid polyketide synthase / nonribosomal peptide synthetase ACE1